MLVDCTKEIGTFVLRGHMGVHKEISMCEKFFYYNKLMVCLLFILQKQISLAEPIKTLACRCFFRAFIAMTNTV